ncbi:MAG: MMPL family transporter, partial [Candidatus Thermoplasmatota archaeon]|nr:MMPL family transporter [Candidatus Thermoplasmatota archaeon]
YGVTLITTDVDVADVLPRGNGNTTAAQNVTSEFQSSFTQQVTLQLPINPEQCRADSERVLQNRPQGTVNCGNITDEVYVRAQEELFQILKEEQDILQFNIGINSFYKLINWTIAGGQDAPPEAFSLPGTSPNQELLYQQVNRTVWTAIPTTVTPVIDPSFEQTASLYIVSSEIDASTQEIGKAALEFRDRYVQMVEDGETQFTVWGEDNPPLFTVDLPVANAHSSALAQEDFVTLFPIIFAFIIVTLYFSFRNFTAIGIAGATLLVAAVWTYGTMGHMGIALNTLNLTVLPLILGVGIDFSIHQITEFANHKREGMSDEEALQISGGYAGFAMFIATVTSSSGLLVMTVSPSLLMAQLGFLSAFGIISVYLLTITFMPALLALAKSSEGMGQKFEPSGFVTSLTRSLSNKRIVVVLLVLVLTGLTAVGSTNLGIEEFGEPALNFPEDDPLRQEHVEGLRGFYDLEDGGKELKTNIVVFEGDNTDLQSHRYIEAIQQEMAAKPNLNLDTSRTLPFLMRTWLTVKGGGPGAVEQLSRDTLATCQPPAGPSPLPGCQPASQAENYPRTRAEIQSELDQMFASPLSTFSALFVAHPNYNISIMTLATTTGSFEDAEAAWNDVWASVDALEDEKPQDLKPAFVGNTATNYLFIEEELPWLSYLGIVSAIVVTLLSIMFTKSIRATLAVVITMGLTSVWWLGVLPSFDIGLAITLMLPAVFITSIGSDYAIHMVWNLLRNPDREEVYGVVGKAVLYSMITTVGAFAIFTQTQNVAASRAMLATVIAIGVIFLATMLIMPIFYPLKEAEDDDLDYVPTTRVSEAPHG